MNTSPTLVTPNIGVATGTSLTTTGNLSAPELISTVATGTAPFTVASTTPVANLSIGGNAATATLATTATNVTTNANLTGPITSVGNATSIGSQTGTGNTFVMNTSPALITPNIGAATGTSLTTTGNLTAPVIVSNVATGTAPFTVASTTPVANLSIGGTAASVTTNANLTGPITSVGNATSCCMLKQELAVLFVMNTSPTLVTPVIGVATGTSLTTTGNLTAPVIVSNVATGTAPFTVCFNHTCSKPEYWRNCGISHHECKLNWSDHLSW
jgi:hypothetical protein